MYRIIIMMILIINEYVHVIAVLTLLPVPEACCVHLCVCVCVCWEGGGGCKEFTNEISIVLLYYLCSYMYNT